MYTVHVHLQIKKEELQEIGIPGNSGIPEIPNVIVYNDIYIFIR